MPHGPIKKAKWSTSRAVHRLLVDCAKPAENGTYFHNRNPRNLEMMKIAHRPDGYWLDSPGRCFWHKLVVEKSSKCFTAKIEHFTGRTVLQSSTEEWSLSKQLYRPYDKAAYINFGRIFAQRCLEAGIIEVGNFIEAKPDGKLESFLKELENNGLKLTESPVYTKSKASDPLRLDKPWMIQND